MTQAPFRRSDSGEGTQPKLSSPPAFDFARVNLWPKATTYPGIAHGWQGSAWVWSQLAATGRSDPSPRVLHAVRKRLSAHEKDSYGVSHLIGSGGDSVVAASLCRIDKSFEVTLRESVRAWEGSLAARFPSESGDVMSGAGGALLAAAEIEGNREGTIGRQLVRKFYARCRRTLETQLSGFKREPTLLGFAHGLAGCLFALETARAAFGLHYPKALRDGVLDALWKSRYNKRVWAWPRFSGVSADGANGWCHGGPGIALALIACRALTGHDDYGALAAPALDDIATRPHTHFSICCGILGQSQILIEAFRITGNRKWLCSAHQLLQEAPRTTWIEPALRRSLWKGLPGYYFLRWRLHEPTEIPFPGLGLLSVPMRSR